MERDDRVDIRRFEPPHLHRGAIPKRRGKYIVHDSASGHFVSRRVLSV
jgi:hypothetical protein